MTEPEPRWRITVRGDNIELRGHLTAPIEVAYALGDAMKPFGLVIASPAPPGNADQSAELDLAAALDRIAAEAAQLARDARYGPARHR